MAGDSVRNSEATDTDTARRALLTMLERDQEVRDDLVRRGTLFDSYDPRMEEVHLEHATRLEAILRRHGWPDTDRFGEDGQLASWTLLMHSISRPDLMRYGRDLLAASAKAGSTPGHFLARLEDRILTLEGQPQTYGTILDWDAEGVLGCLPIRDPASVDARRAEVGLPPLAEHVTRRRQEALAAGEGPPVDRHRKAREYEEWLRRAGWR